MEKMYDFKDFNEIDLHTKIASLYFDAKVTDLQKVGDGFYGTVYKLVLSKAPFMVICKWHKLSGYARYEAAQLRLLKEHEGPIKTPDVYALVESINEIPFECVIMEYIPGINAADIEFPDKKHQKNFVQKIIDNLMHWHGITHDKGFGLPDGPFHPDWQSFYKERIVTMHKELNTEEHHALFSPEVLGLVELSFMRFDDIFSESIKEAVLVHSDYNLWNILINPENFEPVGIIDPSDVCWGDPELDLFHLQNADGDRFQILYEYRQRKKLSNLFPIKNAFYRFWDDIKHYLRMGWYEEKHFLKYGNAVKDMIDRYL